MFNGIRSMNKTKLYHYISIQINENASILTSVNVTNIMLLNGYDTFPYPSVRVVFEMRNCSINTECKIIKFKQKEMSRICF